MDEASLTASREVEWHKSRLHEKDREVEHFRRELSCIMEALMQLKAQSGPNPPTDTYS